MKHARTRTAALGLLAAALSAAHADDPTRMQPGAPAAPAPTGAPPPGAPAKPATLPPKNPPSPGEAARGAAAEIEELSARGLDRALMWGVPTQADRDAARRPVDRAMNQIDGVALGADADAVIGARVRLLDALLSGDAAERARLLDAERALLESVEGPPTVGEAARRLSLACVLVAQGAPGEAARADELLRSVLDLPEGDDAARAVPPATHLDALLGLIVLADNGARAERLGALARERFGEARDRLAIAEAQARALARLAAASSSPPAWDAACAPLIALRAGALGPLSKDDVEELVYDKLGALAHACATLEHLPTLALVGLRTEPALAIAAQREAPAPVKHEALWRLGVVRAEAKPPDRAGAIEAWAQYIESKPRPARDGVDSALRRVSQTLDDWDRAIMSGPWTKTKPPAARAPDEDLRPYVRAVERAEGAIATLRREDAQPARTRQRIARIAIRAGKAQGPWREVAIDTLRALPDDPAVSGETANLVRLFLETRWPKGTPRDAVGLANDVDAMAEVPTMRRQTYQLFGWRAALADVQQSAGQFGDALKTWQGLRAQSSTSQSQDDLDRVVLGIAAAQRALGQINDALATLRELTDRFEEALAGHRPAAYWHAWIMTLEILLDADPTPAGAAAVRLRIRELRLRDGTLGGQATREALEAVDARAAGMQ